MCTFRTHGRREHRLYGCGAQEGVCRKTPDIKQLAVPSGKLHSSLPTATFGTREKANGHRLPLSSNGPFVRHAAPTPLRRS
jgi:hypothetical protein